MKKLSLVAIALATFSLVGCGTTSGSKKEKIHLQLVPSNDTQTLLTRAKALEPILAKAEPNYEWTIDVGTSYAATTTALAAGQIDGGFLTSSGYAQMTLEQPGKVDLLLSAGRAGYKVQSVDFKGTDAAAREKHRKAMNGTNPDTGKPYDYKGQQDPTLVNFYCSVVLTLRDSERTAKGLAAFDTDGDNEVSLAELHAKNAQWGVMGATSSSGFIYPTKYLSDNGYTGGFVDKATYDKKTAEEQSKYFIGAAQTSYPAMIENLMNGVIDVAVGFFDIRYGSAYVQSGGKYEGKDELFTKTYTQAVLDPIMNDTVCASATLSDAKKEAIKRALKYAVADGDKTDDGKEKDVDGNGQPSGSYLLYQIYSHTAYTDGKDSDYDAAREMYRWTLEHNNK